MNFFSCSFGCRRERAIAGEREGRGGRLQARAPKQSVPEVLPSHVDEAAMLPNGVFRHEIAGCMARAMHRGRRAQNVLYLMAIAESTCAFCSISLPSLPLTHHQRAEECFQELTCSVLV